MISVAMATFNGEKYIEKQLLSIVNQTISIDEIVICDDKSTDSTVDIINYFIKQHNLEKKCRVYINDRNIGFIMNFTKAISLTTGDFIFLSDQDDIFYAEKFEKMLEVMNNYQDCCLVNSSYEYIDEKGNYYKNIRLGTNIKDKIIRKVKFDEWLYKSSFPGFAMCIKANIREMLNTVNFDYCYGHDQLIGLLALNCDGNYWLPSILNKYRIHGTNTTGGKLLINNYSISARIKQKEKERDEYIKLRKMIVVNDLNNIDISFLDSREFELDMRILYLKTKKLWKLFFLLFFTKAYPRKTIIGDCLSIILDK